MVTDAPQLQLGVDDGEFDFALIWGSYVILGMWLETESIDLSFVLLNWSTQEQMLIAQMVNPRLSERHCQLI